MIHEIISVTCVTTLVSNSLCYFTVKNKLSYGVSEHENINSLTVLVELYTSTNNYCSARYLVVVPDTFHILGTYSNRETTYYKFFYSKYTFLISDQ